MATPTELRDLIDNLIDPAFDTDQTLAEIETRANADGVSLADLSSLISLVFEPLVSSMVRNRLLSKCLIPRGDYFVPVEIILRVLAAIGAPEVYYSKGKQHKSKRFSLPTQQKILQWTINILPFFGPDLLKTLQRSLPILFGLLSYEFSRPYISTLIIVATSRHKRTQEKTVSPYKDLGSFQKGPLRTWHMQLVADLSERFPMDPSLKALMLHISRSSSSRDFYQLFGKHHSFSFTRSSGFIAVPEDSFSAILRLKDGLHKDGLSKEILGLHQDLSQIYKDFERSPKKRRLDLQASLENDPFNSMSSERKVPISSIDSVPSLISNLENISFINPSSVFAQKPSLNHRFRCLYASLILLNSSSSHVFFKKISSALQHHILLQDTSDAYRDFSVDSFGKYGTVRHFRSELESFLMAPESASEKRLLVFENQLCYMPYYHLTSGKCIITALNRLLSCVNDLLAQKRTNANTLIPRLFIRLTVLIRKLGQENEAGEVLTSITPLIFHMIDKNWVRLDLTSKLSFLAFMNSTIAFATKKLDSWQNVACLIPPPSLVFRLVVSVNPIVVSETLGYIAMIKKLRLSESDALKSSLKNAYVMDSINFVWRDMAFKHEKRTINQGMYLHPQFIQRMSGLDFFSNSELISIKSVGGIVQNPSFAYLCAELIWKLEDMEAEISTRHPGPISEQSVARMNEDADVIWLNMNYQELKVSLLNSLDVMGFHGIADLLFTSLKPLVNQRANEPAK
ncbi:hypothetical protein OXX69_007195 [Metschnikowia pulcherrima]